MPDEIPPSNELDSQPLLPTEPQNSTPPADESSGKTNPADKNSVRKRIRKSVAQVFDVAGVLYRAGRGRPKKCTKCNGAKCDACGWTGIEPKISDKPINEDKAGNNPPVEKLDDEPTAEPALEIGQEIPAGHLPVSNPRVDEVFRACLIGTAKGYPEGLIGITKIMAGMAEIDKEFTEKTLSKASPNPEDVKNLAGAVEIFAEKHAPKIKNNREEASLSMALFNMTVPFIPIWADFAREIARKKKLEGKP